MVIPTIIPMPTTRTLMAIPAASTTAMQAEIGCAYMTNKVFRAAFPRPKVH